MSIATQVEMTLVGDADHTQYILHSLQQLGAVHLVPLQATPPESGPDAADDVREAFHYLCSAPAKRRSQRPTDDRPLDAIVNDVRNNKYQRDEVIDRIEIIRRRQRVLAPWGNFEFPKLDEIDQMRLWFYCVPLGKLALLEAMHLSWKVIHSDQRFHYLVVLAQEEPDEHDIPFPRAHTGTMSLSQLAALREDAMVRLEDLDAERESLTRWILPLSDALDQSLDQRELSLANNQVLNAKQLFALQDPVNNSV